MKKVILSSILISAAISSSALAQVSSDQAQTPTPLVPSAQAQQTDAAQNSVPQAQPGSSATSTSVEVTPVVVPVPVIVETPKASVAFFEKVNEMWNSKDVDGIMNTFSKDGFVIVSGNGDVYKDADSFKNMLVNMFSGDKKMTSTIKVDSLKDIAPGIAVANGSLNWSVEGLNDTMESLFTSTIKYEDNAWKTISWQDTQTKKVEAQSPMHEESSKGGGFKMLLTAILGAAAGFMGARYLAKREQSQPE